MKLIVCGMAAALLVAGCASNHVINEPAGAARPEIADAEPQAASSILAEINEHQTELQSALNSSRIADVQRHAYAIRDLSDRLVQQADSATSGQVAAIVRDIERVTESLDRLAVTRQLSLLQSDVRDLQLLLDRLESQFEAR